MTLRSIRAAATIAACLPAFAAAQKPYVLSARDAEFSDPFTSISGVRELRDGRVLVADARDRTLQIVDLKTGAATPVGHEGSGPGEYSLPMRLYGLPGDTSLIFDAGNQRYLTIDPDGKAGKDFRLEAEPARGGGRGRIVMGGLAIPRGVDARGDIFYEGPPFALGPDGPVSADSVPILRYRRSTGRVDTLAYSHPAKNSASVSGGRGNMTVRIGGANPLLPRDDWAALPDGRVAVVRGADYHVDVYGGPRVVKGPAVPYNTIKVDGAVKQMVEDARAKGRRNAVSMTVNSGSGGTQRATQIGGAGLPPAEPLTDWPDMMPAFLAANTLPGGGVVARPNGELWVPIVQRPGFTAIVYDVFDASGKVIGRVALPPATRLVGFGNGTVYVIRIDADDLQYLQRYRLPNDAKLVG